MPPNSVYGTPEDFFFTGDRGAQGVVCEGGGAVPDQLEAHMFLLKYVRVRFNFVFNGRRDSGSSLLCTEAPYRGAGFPRQTPGTRLGWNAALQLQLPVSASALTHARVACTESTLPPTRESDNTRRTGQMPPSPKIRCNHPTAQHSHPEI